LIRQKTYHDWKE